MPHTTFSRRAALNNIACGFGALAATGLMAERTAVAASEAENPLAAKPTMFPARAKRVIFIFMQGGPSQVDTFDYKPTLYEYDGKKHEFRNARAREVRPEAVMKPLWKFKQHGQSGQWVSELFPELTKHVDDLCFIKSMHTEGVAHGPSTLFLHTGATNLIRPSVGSWITYGLGTENRNLPGFVTICPSATKGGPRNYGTAFLPPAFQGTALGRGSQPATNAKFQFVANSKYDKSKQLDQFELLQELNRVQRSRLQETAEADAVINSFELAFRLQAAAPLVTDLSNETRGTLDMYGIDRKETDDFGRQCLMARRLSEAGVRFVQINYSDNGATPRWDQHGNMPKHAEHAKAVDQPVAALLTDLKRRGLLEDTLVWWGGEFGRTPFSQNGNGRDHNPDGFTIWLAGGGVKQGFCYGETDEFGHQAVTNKVHMHDMHATLLHLLGVDHKQLTYPYAGRDFRLTDVHGRVVTDIMA